MARIVERLAGNCDGKNEPWRDVLKHETTDPGEVDERRRNKKQQNAATAGDAAMQKPITARSRICGQQKSR
jgi:hypothetical protein